MNDVLRAGFAVLFAAAVITYVAIVTRICIDMNRVTREMREERERIEAHLAAREAKRMQP